MLTKANVDIWCHAKHISILFILCSEQMLKIRTHVLRNIARLGDECDVPSAVVGPRWCCERSLPRHPSTDSRPWQGPVHSVILARLLIKREPLLILISPNDSIEPAFSILIQNEHWLPCCWRTTVVRWGRYDYHAILLRKIVRAFPSDIPSCTHSLIVSPLYHHIHW